VVVDTASDRRLRPRVLAFALAGVGASAVVVAVVAGFSGTDVRIALIAALLLQATNLIPATLKLAMGRMDSDGRLALRALFGRRADLESRFVIPGLVRALQNEVERDPVRARDLAGRLRSLRGSSADRALLLDIWTRGSLREEFPRGDAVIARLVQMWTTAPDTDTFLLVNCLNGVAYQCLLEGDPIDPPFVAALRGACARANEDAALADTLAWALLRAGDVPEADRLSRIALAAQLPPDRRAAITAVHALVLVARDRIDDARAARATVVELDPGCPVLAHLDRELSARRPASPDA
jgi:hypothetical protein